MKKSVKLHNNLGVCLKKSVLFGIAASIVISLSGCMLLPKEEEVLAPPLKEPPKITYETIDVKKGSIEKKVTYTASFEPVKYYDLYFKNSSRLKSIYVSVGQAVKKGQLLAEMDTESIQNQIAQQQIAVEKSQLAYDQIKDTLAKNAVASQYNLERMSYDIDMARIQLSDLQKSLVNWIMDPQKVSSPGNYSSSDIESIKSQIEQKTLALKKLESSYNQALQESQSDSSSDLQKAAYDLELSRLQLSISLDQLEKCRLYAPEDSIVNSIDTVKEGSVIEPYKTLIRLLDPTKLQLRYTGDKTSDFVLGAKVSVKIKGTDYEGEITMTPANMPPDASDTMKKSAIITVKDLPEGITYGTSATITIIQDRKDDVIVLSKDLVQKYMGTNKVQVLENNIKKARNVELGIQTDTEVEIVKGLEVGEKVVVR